MALVELIKDPTRRQLRQFGALFLPGFLGLVAVLVRRSSGTFVVAGPLLGAAGVSIVAALVSPAWLRAPFVGLQYLAFPIGWVLSHAILAIVYFGVVTPIGCLVRVFRRDPLRRRLDPGAASHWTARKAPASIERYFRPY
jgi:hypothetical protein